MSDIAYYTVEADEQKLVELLGSEAWVELAFRTTTANGQTRDYRFLRDWDGYRRFVADRTGASPVTYNTLAKRLVKNAIEIVLHEGGNAIYRHYTIIRPRNYVIQEGN